MFAVVSFVAVGARAADDAGPRPPEPADERLLDFAPRPPEPPDEVPLLAADPIPPEPPGSEPILPPVRYVAVPYPPRPPEPDEIYEVLVKDAPEDRTDLWIMQEHVKRISREVIPCTVGIVIGGAQGSGVIVSPDGYVMTAGHVSGEANRSATLILPDGRTVRGRTLGANRGIDSGMVKILDPHPGGGDWPCVEMGRSKPLVRGQWVICTGHPGGYQRGRPPVLRLGRIQDPGATAIVTDCTLVGGDSGGPLFDLEGRVIGINSRIAGPLTANIHVPVDTFHDTWDRLAKSDVWGGPGPSSRGGGPFVGIVVGQESDVCKVVQVAPDSPAAKAGVKVGDVIKSFAGQPVKNNQEFVSLVGKKKPGEKVSVVLLRDNQTVTLDIVVGRRPG
jgi:serine protease Do